MHDNANGLGLWSESVGSDAYGNIIYHNGWQAPDRAHGHGIYTQNQAGVRRIADNIIFNQFSHGIHAYGSASAHLDNITLEGNIVFNNGALAEGPEYERNILLGGGRPATNPRLEENMTYFGSGKSSGENNVGHESGCVDLQARGNYLVGPRPLQLRQCEASVFISNTFYASEKGGLPVERYGNTYLDKPPTGTKVFVRPNRCEPGRAHVAIYNWDLRSEVSVDLSPGSLVRGERYRDTRRAELLRETSRRGYLRWPPDHDSDDRTADGRAGWRCGACGSHGTPFCRLCRRAAGGHRGRRVGASRLRDRRHRPSQQVSEKLGILTLYGGIGAS